MSKMSTAASLGSDSDSHRDDDFDDDEDTNVDAFGDEGIADNDELLLDSSCEEEERKKQQQVKKKKKPLVIDNNDVLPSIRRNSAGGLIDDISHMSVKARERRLIMESLRPASIDGQRQKCMSVSNVASIQQQANFRQQSFDSAESGTLKSEQVHPKRSSIPSSQLPPLPQRPDRNKSYTSTQLSVPKILLSET